MIKNTFLRLVFAFLCGIALSIAFTTLFLRLTERALPDQIALVFFPTAAFGYLIFTWPASDFSRFILNLREGGFRALAQSRDAALVLLRENAPGLALALIFTGIYLYFGVSFNDPRVEMTDNFLDADNSSWAIRIAAQGGFNMEMRPPHPFAYLIFRPLGWIGNLFTQSPAFTAILLNALAGGLCVFFAWLFIKSLTQNRIYAFLIATLLGLSTAHFFFGSVIETYIFSATTLIGFYLALQTRKDSMGAAVSVSVITFGITFTNFIQNLIGFIVSRPRWKEIIRFAGLTISIGVILSMVHAAWYPSAKLFFVPTDAFAEGDYSFPIFSELPWRVAGRVNLLTRTTLLYSIVAPHPFSFVSEVQASFPTFSFFNIIHGEFNVSSYRGLGHFLIQVWVLFLLGAGVSFLWNLFRTRKADLTLAFALCIAFNFALHLTYGYEPFLYSPDWTYALIFFVAIGLAPLAKRRWFQVALALFLILLAINQWQFNRLILDTVAPYIKGGG